MHIERLTDDYDIWHQVSGHSAKTRDWYRWILRTFTRWLATTGRSPLVTDITISDARAFLQSEAERTVLCPAHPTGVERPGMLSDRTLQGYARALRGFFAWLEAEEYLAVSPMRKLKLPRVEERLKDVLAVPDIERLLAVCNTKTFLGSRMYAMVALMYDSGLRAGEVVNLDLGDIDWGEYRIKIRRGKGKKDRFEPFSVATHRALRRYFVLRERFALDGQTVLFISAAGDTITRGALTQAVKRLGKRAGIPHVHPHLFRHSAAIAALENSASQSEVSRFLGHSQVGTTDIYLKHITKKMGERHRQFSPMARVNAPRAQAAERTRKRKR